MPCWGVMSCGILFWLGDQTYRTLIIGIATVLISYPSQTLTAISYCRGSEYLLYFHFAHQCGGKCSMIIWSLQWNEGWHTSIQVWPNHIYLFVSYLMSAKLYLEFLGVICQQLWGFAQCVCEWMRLSDFCDIIYGSMEIH